MNTQSRIPSTPSTTPTRGPSPATKDLRAIAGIHAAPAPHWVGDGFRVSGYFSAIPDAVRRLDPFLLVDYHTPYTYGPSKEPRGVGVHPHRGFETVTLVWEGKVAHHDSAGGGGVIGPGDVQWMTAGAGVLHKEYHDASFSEQGGRFHVAQIWVNLPRAHKMAPPAYQPLTADGMGFVRLPGDAGEVRVIAGEFEGVRGAARTHSPIGMFDAHLRPGGSVTFDVPSHHNAALLVMAGRVTVGGAPDARASANDFVVFANSGERVVLSAEDEAHVLLLTGEPLDEPIVHYGPFVMNTEEEILQAFDDVRRGKFGHLDDAR